MTYFGYEAIYFGIMVGLALANILSSIHKLVETGPHVHWGWMAPASAACAAKLLGARAAFDACKTAISYIAENVLGQPKSY